MAKIRKNSDWRMATAAMPADLLADLDRVAVAQGASSRSAVIRLACERFVAQSPLTSLVRPAPTLASERLVRQ